MLKIIGPLTIEVWRNPLAVDQNMVPWDAQRVHVHRYRRGWNVVIRTVRRYRVAVTWYWL